MEDIQLASRNREYSIFHTISRIPGGAGFPSTIFMKPISPSPGNFIRSSFSSLPIWDSSGAKLEIWSSSWMLGIEIKLHRFDFWIRLAIQHGVPLLPVYAFGENQLFRSLGVTFGHGLLWVKSVHFRGVFFADSPAFRNQDSGLGSTHQSIFLQEALHKMVKGTWRKFLKLVDHNYSQSTWKAGLAWLAMELDESYGMRWVSL